MNQTADNYLAILKWLINLKKSLSDGINFHYSDEYISKRKLFLFSDNQNILDNFESAPIEKVLELGLSSIFDICYMNKSNPYQGLAYQRLNIIVERFEHLVVPMGYEQLLERASVNYVVHYSLLMSASNIANYKVPININVWVESRKRNLPFFTGLFIGKAMVGQLAVSLIDSSDYDKMKAGTIDEESIISKNITYTEANIGYISTFSLLEGIRNFKMLKMIVKKFLLQYEKESEKGFYFEKVLAIAATSKGIKLCEALGMSCVSNSITGEPIFEGEPKNISNTPLFRKIASI